METVIHQILGGSKEESLHLKTLCFPKLSSSSEANSEPNQRTKIDLKGTLMQI